MELFMSKKKLQLKPYVVAGIFTSLVGIIGCSENKKDIVIVEEKDPLAISSKCLTEIDTTRFSQTDGVIVTPEVNTLFDQSYHLPEEVSQCIIKELKISTLENTHDKAKKIEEFVNKAIIDDEMDYEGLKHPVITLKQKKGDCEDQTAVMLSLLNSAGIESRILKRLATPELPGHYFSAYVTNVKSEIYSPISKYSTVYALDPMIDKFLGDPKADYECHWNNDKGCK
jgi:hypothetical protein